jgi:hypothetical protein
MDGLSGKSDGDREESAVRPGMTALAQKRCPGMIKILESEEKDRYIPSIFLSEGLK